MTNVITTKFFLTYVLVDGTIGYAFEDSDSFYDACETFLKETKLSVDKIYAAKIDNVMKFDGDMF